ncbi:MAG: hypothetical protein ACTSXQ_00405 [Alphaproteobacteria bacterium]
MNEIKSTEEKMKWIFSEEALRFYHHDMQIIYMQVQDIVDTLERTQGLTGILALANTVEDPEILAKIYALYHQNESRIISEAIRQSHGKSKNLSAFAGDLSTHKRKHDPENNWPSFILDLINQENWTPAEEALLILYWPHTKETWDFIEKLQKETGSHYWETANFWGSKELTLSEINFLAQKLLKHDRAIDALEVIHENTDTLEIQLISKTLKNAAPQYTQMDKDIALFPTYYVEHIFKGLLKRSDIKKSDRIAMEKDYLSTLKEASIPTTSA